jgi:hypothetical protein
MTRALLVARVVFSVCTLAAAFTAGVGAQSPADPRPQLGVTGKRPFEVRGVGFEPSERVQVLLAANGRQHWRTAVASSGGVFRVRFDVSLGACARYTLQAFGSEGSRVRVLPRKPRVDCVSPDRGGSQTS